MLAKAVEKGPTSGHKRKTEQQPIVAPKRNLRSMVCSNGTNNKLLNRPNLEGTIHDS